jgi:hypothetical protein
MEELRAAQERRWRHKAANDMLAYRNMKDDSMRRAFGRPDWSNY